MRLLFQLILYCVGKELCQISESDVSDVSSAVESAKRAFEHWSVLSGSERSKFLFKAAQLIKVCMNRLFCIIIKH